jgi:predicted nucleotidyltransferase
MQPADDRFLNLITDQLAALPRVDAVALGGSRATGTHRPDSDWDFAIYYRGAFSPDSLRALGWPGEVSELGGWGGGVFNGGGWLEVEGRRVDVHYRDLDDVEHHLAEAQEGRFHIERLLFHLAGIPSYIVVAELAGNRVLHGTLPRPVFPEKLKESARGRWWGEAELTLGYARTAYAEPGLLTETLGAVATAACMAAHAILAGRGEWVTNEKRLVDRAGLRGIDGILSGRQAPQVLEEATAYLRSAVESGGERPRV